jgi:hypothetical protein
MRRLTKTLEFIPYLFITPVLSVITHEIGHAIALTITKVILNDKQPLDIKIEFGYPPFKVKLFKEFISFSGKNPLNGRTRASLYKVLETHKEDKAVQRLIKFNALSGIIMSLLSALISVTVLSSVTSVSWFACLLIVGVPWAATEIAAFTTGGSDLKIFKNPENFQDN